MKKLNECKFEIGSHSPSWHERYNAILERYIELRESSDCSPVSSLSEDDCVTLAINMAHIDPFHEDDVDRESVLSRIESMLFTPVGFMDHVEIKGILPINNIGKNTLNVLLVAHNCVWADPNHLSYSVLSVNKELIRSEAEIDCYLAKSRRIIAYHVLHSFHAYHHKRSGNVMSLWHRARMRWYRYLSALYKITL